MSTRYVFLITLLLLVSAAAQGDTSYQPFVLASINDSTLQEQTEATVSALEEAGFRVAGHYAPLDNAVVVVVTSPELQNIAAQSDKGGYAAGHRVSITERGGKTEVAFVNPQYIQYAYRLGAQMQGIYDQLSAALGTVETYGAEKEMTAKKLDKYHYMIGMQRFDDPSALGSFESHEAAVSAVEQGLAVENDALTQVYRIEIPGKDQVVFGVAMKALGESKDERSIDEAYQLAIVDFDGYSKVAYFPYEILVDGANVEALHMRFRMAVHFPDLDMLGEHGFMKLRASPGAIEDAFEALVGAK